MAHLLNPSYLPQININCIDSKFCTIEKKIANVIKIKINSSHPDVVKNKIEEVLKTCKSSVKVRLDFNGILNFSEAKKIFHVIRNYNIDYVEQPFAPKNLKDITRLREITEVKIALDESVNDFFSIKNVVEKKIVDTIIIKPTLIGGFNDIKKINEYCKKNNVRIILTSSFETEIAQNYIIHLISALEIKEYCGVANIELFSKSHHKRDDDKITLPKLLR
jgi:L-alanine-DL-glutamate epimerase-like enolase superfamily enzyme